jgi:hypothetical protein
MPRAYVLTTASKATTTGGTFADTLAVNSGDSLSVANFNEGEANFLEMWGNDSASVMEGQLIYTRPQSTHDQSHGFRFQNASLLANVAAKVGAQEYLPGNVGFQLYKSDTATIQVTSTASDNAAVSYNILYDDLPGSSAVLISPQQASNLQNSIVGINVAAVTSATRGAYGASRAFNADDARLHANTWYAIVGYTLAAPIMTVSLIGPDWGGQRLGGPGDPLTFRTGSYFFDQSDKWKKPLVPCFNSNNVGNVLVQLADVAASSTPGLDFTLYELNGNPQAGV